ncbi:flagellin [Agrobacterium sp. SHOUNA12C]|uniref:Flagellin n=2 Tax=Rhizobium rhizogenes TaxID=359 RepID=B9J979_RHIR8|nr:MULTISPECIES: flagellin [Rhizobium]ACM25481.1 flagellin protein [Rhizobium rhizogenes K84]KAA6486785.1 flagellin [Agrobacterium sp. ICMP 7243]MCJ9722396.1 flagellin [Agrobacterium sp. BETTINA12B]MCJ9757571.1 flagellin [Agrobacterium sp. SHOUNA12C]OCI98101.1 flagellin [Agrobacterium sp. 13-626]OCJ21826.1 flagellin [Agrobacterium sp. B131/95]OCJ26731.1 flagellin [Agrobacterium sp. B133/95]
MTSILTNDAAMSALQTLRSISTNLEDTQNRVSSGYRVAKASDNAAYWSIATTMRSDNSALSAVSDALGLGAAKVDTAYTAMDNSITIVQQIKDKLVAATENSVDKADVQEEISQLQQQLESIAQSASFSGQNWMIAADGASASVVSSFVRNNDGSVAVNSTSYSFDTGSAGNVMFGADASGTIDTTSGILGTKQDINGTSYSVFSLDITDMTSGDIAQAMNLVQSALNTMTSTASQLGSLSTRIDLQTSFVSALSDTIDSGVGKLVDANMEEESSKLTALQTQQQLAIQSLQIANSSAQNVLALFK